MKKYLKQYKDPGGATVIPRAEEAFRKYSERMKEFLNGLYIDRKDGPVPVEVVYSFPNIATALRSAPSYDAKPEVNRELGQKLVDLREERTKIPIIAFQISGYTYVMDRQLPGEIYYNVQYTDASKKNIIRANKPVPFDLQYTLSIWTKTKADMFFVQQQILSKFNPTVTFEVDTQEIPVFLDSITDTSSLESATGTYQLVRNDIVLHLNAWIKRNDISVRTIHRDKMAFHEMVIDKDGKAVSGEQWFVVEAKG